MTLDTRSSFKSFTRFDCFTHDCITNKNCSSSSDSQKTFKNPYKDETLDNWCVRESTTKQGWLIVDVWCVKLQKIFTFAGSADYWSNLLATKTDEEFGDYLAHNLNWLGGWNDFRESKNLPFMLIPPKNPREFYPDVENGAVIIDKYRTMFMDRLFEFYEEASTYQKVIISLRERISHLPKNKAIESYARRITLRASTVIHNKTGYDSFIKPPYYPTQPLRPLTHTEYKDLYDEGTRLLEEYTTDENK